VNQHASPSPTPPQSPRSGVTLFLKLLAVAAAGSAQAFVYEQPWLSIAGFACGGLLFLVAERRSPALPDPPERLAAPAAKGFWTLFAVGCALGVAAGILVFRGAEPKVTHPPWALGLLCFTGAALWSWWGNRARRRPPPRVLATAALLLLLAGGFFGWQVARVPPELHGDEGEIGLDAVQLLTQKPFNLFSAGWYFLPRFHALRQAAGIKLFGVNTLGLRCTSVVLGAAAVLVVFIVGYRLWGFEVGLCAGLLLVSARFFIHLSRTGFHYLDTPFLSILVVGFAWLAWRDLRLDATIWCGIALGLGVQSYFASRLVPALLTLTWCLWLIGCDRRLLLRRLGRFALVAIVALATAAPMIGFFWKRPLELWMRTQETSVFTQGAFDHLSNAYGTRDLRYILLVQLQHAVTLFNYSSDSSLQYGFRPGGMFEPISATLFVLGLAGVCAHPLRRRNLLLLVWIIVPVIVGGALTIDTPFYPRISGVVPFAVLVIALALHSVLASVGAVLPHRIGRWAVTIVGIGVIAVVLATNVRDYFIEYAPHHRHGPGLEIAAWIRAHGTGKTTYMVGGKGFFIKHGTIRFLTYGYAIDDVIDLNVYLRTNHFNPATSLFIVMPQGRALIPRLQAAVGPLDVQPQRFRDDPAAFYTAVPLTPATTPPRLVSAPAAR
jgi:hypothetical protein